MKEWIDEEILAILPSYEGNKGNCTRIHLSEEQRVIDKTTRTIIKRLCSHFHMDLKSSNRYYGRLLSIKSAIPLAITPETIYIQLKTREPIGKDDGAMGYIKLKSINKVFEKEGLAIIRMENHIEIPCLCSLQTVEKQIRQGNLVRELFGNKEKDSVKESLEYYHSKDGPAMKSDIARLYMKIDDLLAKIQ